MMRWGGIVAFGLGLMALTACTQTSPPQTTPISSTPPKARATEPAPIAPIVVQPTVQDDALRTYYKRLENDLLTRGLLRTDGGGPDTPFTDTQLTRNFVRIALFDEYVSDARGLRATPTESKLRRWDQPVRMSVEFGEGTSAEQRVKDRANVARYANRLSRISGLSITQTDVNPNYYVLFLNENDRLNSEARLREIVPGIAPSSVRAILGLPRDQLCIVVAFSEQGRSDYSKAVAVVRDEHSDLMRQSCIHEELAQGLGLANDSPAARPSIFNDDEEFGLLTTHDELLLKMLYDRRLTSGMTAEQATPIAKIIATELTGGSAS